MLLLVRNPCEAATGRSNPDKDTKLFTMYKAVSGIFCNFAPRNTAIPMRLKKLSLLHFKNIARQELEFCRGVNCLVGDNGAGK